MASFEFPPIPVAPASGPELGAFALGTVFTLVLAGLAAVQTLDYLTCAFFIAPKAYLGLAVVLLAAGLLQASFCFFGSYKVTGTSFHSAQLRGVTSGPFPSPALSPASRTPTLSKAAHRFKGLVFAVFTAVATCSLVLAIIASVKIDEAPEDWTSFMTYRWLLIAWMWTLASLTLAMAACLIFVEAGAVSEPAATDKSSRFSRLFALFYRANLVGALVAFVDAVLISALPFRGWHNILFLPLNQLYISAVVISLEHVYNVEIETLEATTSSSPSTGLHNSHLRSIRQRGLDRSVSRSGGDVTTEILEGEVELQAHKDSSTQNGSTTEVGSVSEKDSINASPTFALRSVITHCEPIRIPNHPYAIAAGEKEQRPTGRHPYAAPAHEND